MNNAVEKNQPPPDFSGRWSCIAGLRPYRKNSYRLGAEIYGDKFVVHNYGHGGAGITMSWGCAHEVRDIINGRPVATDATRVAVLGAGVMGLTAATLLVEMGMEVTVYAREFIPHTTSNVAGGQWAPSVVEYDQSPDGRKQFHRILRRAFKTHEAKIGEGFGVSRRPNYTEQRSSSFDKVPKDLVPEPRALDHLPFEKLRTPGYVYQTLLIEPPIFLARLEGDLKAAGVQFVQTELSGLADVQNLRERVVANCTGLGSRKLWPDTDLIPIKGQLALLRPQPELEYLFSASGYVFPREDAVVVGGSYEPGVEDPTPDPKMCEEIVATMKDKFDGKLHLLEALPDWFIRNK